MNTISKDEEPVYASNEERWQAVAEKDRKADGQFVYAVKTTGVYCRPSCPELRRNEPLSFPSDFQGGNRREP